MLAYIPFQVSRVIKLLGVLRNILVFVEVRAIILNFLF